MVVGYKTGDKETKTMSTFCASFEDYYRASQAFQMLTNVPFHDPDNY